MAGGAAGAQGFWTGPSGEVYWEPRTLPGAAKNGNMQHIYDPKISGQMTDVEDWHSGMSQSQLFHTVIHLINRPRLERKKGFT